MDKDFISSNKIIREEFRRRLWTLVRLRYRLIWAQARTSNGKIALLFALYLLGASAALLLAVSGLGAAIADTDFNQNGLVARWMLTIFFINGACLSIMFGVGTQAAFAEESLRRYPLSGQERFIVRQIIGLLDPIWMILSVGVFGLVGGFAWLGKGAIITGLPAALFFIAASYLATTGLLSIISLIMRSRKGAALMGVVVLLLVSLGPLVISLIATSKRVGLWKLLDQILRLTPPGAAAAMMTGDTLLTVASNALLLMIWVAALVWAVNKLETLPPVIETSVTGRITWDDYYDQIAGLFGRNHAPLVSKSLRYHLRCNLIRFSLITSPMLVLIGKFMIPDRSVKGEVIITFALFFITSAATGVAMMLNAFGYEGAGVRRYAFLPASFAAGLRASSFASLMLRAVTMLAALAVWIALARTPVGVRMFVVIFSIVMISLFLFNALGLWTSVLSPKSANFDAMWNNRLSFGANVVMIGGVVVPYLVAIALSERLDPEVLLNFWWASLSLMFLSIGIYLFSLKAIEPVLNARREKLINLIAGGRDK
ncbi:MAG: hypothetical protein ACREBD_15290 [Blastocatellia bacterium]